MKEEEIKDLLLPYVYAEMDLIRPEEMSGYDHIYSSKYEKKMKHLLWGEKYFGRKVWLGYAVRYAAIAASVMICLLTVGEVSARVFRFSFWEYIVSYNKNNQSEEKNYGKRAEEEGMEQKLPAYDIPQYIPEGFEQTAYNNDDIYLYIQWNLSNIREIQFQRIEIQEGAVLGTDGEYDSKEEIRISGLKGYYYIKGEEEWICWDDSKYTYLLDATNVKDASQLLIKMAESLYKS